MITAPVELELPGKVLQVALGQASQYALLEDGTAVSWGANDEGSWATARWARATPMKAAASSRRFR